MHQVGIAGLVWGSLVEGPEVTEALREWWWRGVEGWNLAMLLVQPGLALSHPTSSSLQRGVSHP